jgi:undecaprenyl diphosphate synthase
MESPVTETPTDLLSRLDRDRLPRHIAIITDGNGRWASKHNVPRALGHAQGYEALRPIVNLCSRLGVGYLTCYSFSSENWRRSADEIHDLMSLIEHAAATEIENLHRENIRFNVIGRMDELPASLRNELQRDMELTGGNTGLTFTLAINYGSRGEITDAVRRIVASGVPADVVDEELIHRSLYTHGIPDPDLLIRTANERRISNFLLWQIAYTEIYVSDVLWPDFGEDDLMTAILDYQQRTRRFGGRPE